MTKRRRNIIVAVISVPACIICWHMYYRATSSSRAVDTVSMASDTARTQSQSAIRVLTYNIAHGRGLAESNWDGGSVAVRMQRLNEIAAVLREAEADIVVLNEVDFSAPWSGGVDQSEYLARAAGFEYIARQRNIDIALPFFTLCFGNVILSRLPISSAVHIDLPAYSGIESVFAGKKMGLFVELDTTSRGSIGVIAVHLEHRDEATRVESAKVFKALCLERDIPLIAAGDFNSHPTGTPNVPFDEDGRNAIDVLLQSNLFLFGTDMPPSEIAWTFPSNEPRKTLDWIFVTSQFRVLATNPIESTLSDHLPVLTVLAMPSGD